MIKKHAGQRYGVASTCAKTWSPCLTSSTMGTGGRQPRSPQQGGVEGLRGELDAFHHLFWCHCSALFLSSAPSAHSEPKNQRTDDSP